MAIKSWVHLLIKSNVYLGMKIILLFLPLPLITILFLQIATLLI